MVPHSTSYRDCAGWAGAIASILMASLPNITLAQNITLDGTLGPATTLTGPDYIIPQNVGTTIGSNLFHSFGRFSLDSGETANLQSDANIRNILSRVTGGLPSIINGLLFTESGNVNLFLINPNGIIFGPNAQLNIGASTRGSFIATTVDAILFSNGSQFSATNPGNTSSLLTIVGDPSGFLASQRQPGTIQSTSQGLAVWEGQSLVFLGGDLSFDDGSFTGTGIGGNRGGTVQVGSVAGAGTIQLNGSGNLFSLTFPNDLPRGDISFRNGSRVNVFAESGGSLSIYARKIDVLSGSQLLAGIGGGLGAVGNQAGDITLDATGTVTVSGRSGNQNSQIFNAVSRRDSIGNAGNIRIQTRSLNIMDGGEINSSTFGQGNAGNVLINAQTVFLDAGFQANGSRNQGGILSNASPSVTGEGGDIRINADTLSLTHGSTLNTATTGQGNAGDIVIDVRSLSVTGGAKITADTNNGLNAGNVIIKATEAIQVDGFGVNPVTGQVIVNEDGDPLTSQIISGVKSGRGQGGEIRITTDRLSVSNGAELTAITFGQGNAGNMIVNVRESIVLSGQGTGLFASTQSGSAGNGGSISINSDIHPGNDSSNVTLRDGATIAVNSDGSGTGGNITLRADRLEMSDRASITTETASTQGGKITLDIKDLVLMRRNSLISTNAGLAGAGGNGGNITINVPNGFLVTAPNENNDITANAFNGSGGKVNITAQGIYWFTPRSRADLVQLLRTNDPTQLDPRRLTTNDITAISQGNPELNGRVAINLLGLDPNRGLITLPVNLTDPSQQISQDCKPGSKVARSSFIITGRGGLPPTPEQPMKSPATITRWVELPKEISHRIQQQPLPLPPEPIAEAQSWFVHADGTVELVAEGRSAHSTHGSTMPVTCQSTLAN